MARFDREGNPLEPIVKVICPDCKGIMDFYEYTEDLNEVYICECGIMEIY